MQKRRTQEIDNEGSVLKFCVVFQSFVLENFVSGNLIVYLEYTPLHKKLFSFPLRVSSVNLTRSTGNCGFGQIYRRNLQWKTSFYVQHAELLKAVILLREGDL